MFCMNIYTILPIVCTVTALEVQLTARKAMGTPCCLDTLPPGVCKVLYNKDSERFSKQCRTNPDFSFIQCCHSCHFNSDLLKTYHLLTDLYQTDANEMLIRTNSNSCFDRHGTAFCEAFVTRSGRWIRNLVTCQHSAFAFRVCRKTCGYCSASKSATVNYDSRKARNQKQCERLF